MVFNSYVDILYNTTFSHSTQIYMFTYSHRFPLLGAFSAEERALGIKAEQVPSISWPWADHGGWMMDENIWQFLQMLKSILSAQEVILGWQCEVWWGSKKNRNVYCTLSLLFWNKRIMGDRKLLGSSNFICIPLSNLMFRGWVLYKNGNPQPHCGHWEGGSRRSFQVFNSAVDASSWPLRRVCYKVNQWLLIVGWCLLMIQ